MGSKKNSLENNDFPDLSLFEGNNSLNLKAITNQQKSLQMTGDIKNDEFLYSGGSSLLQINEAFLPAR